MKVSIKPTLLYILIGFLGFLCQSCKPVNVNKFGDPIIVEIYNLKDKRWSNSLYPFFKSRNPLYRAEAAMAFGSIQDSTANNYLGDLLLHDSASTVRKSAAFALGQTGGLSASQLLLNALQSEKQNLVLREVLENFGKVLSHDQLNFLLDFTSQDPIILEGKLWGMYRCRNRGITSQKASEVVSKYLNQKYQRSIRIGAANFFSATDSIEIIQHLECIKKSLLKDPLPEVRLALAQCLGKFKSDDNLLFLGKVATSDQDWHVRAYALKAMQHAKSLPDPYLFIKAVRDTNVHVANVASESIKTIGVVDNIIIDSIIHEVRKAIPWNIKVNLYESIFLFKKDTSIFSEIKQLYKNSNNPFEKAAYINVLKSTTSNYSFIAAELLNSKVPVIRTTAVAALYTINRRKSFPQKLKIEFLNIYKEAILLDDDAVVDIVAQILHDPFLRYRETLNDNDLELLYTVKAKLKMPQHYHAMQSLEVTIAELENRKPQKVKNSYNEIDWEKVKSISKDQRVIVRTTKGQFELELLVESAPGVVANFIKLVDLDYFDNQFIHHSNYDLIQSGNHRGDGWGTSLTYSMHSEFSNINFNEGTVGSIASNNDCEDSQWFISKIYLPNLDYKHTAFARVTKGLDIVNSLEVGDKILDIKFK